MGGTIAATPSQLSDAAPSFTGHVETANELVSGLKSSAQHLGGSLLAVDSLAGFGFEMDTLSGRVGTSLDCFTNALRNVGHSLQVSAESFTATDKQLAKTFELIDQAFTPYLGFDSPAQKPAPPAHHGRGFFGSIWHGLTTGYHDVENFQRRVQHDTHNIPIIGPFIEPSDPGMPGEPVPVEPPIEIPVPIG
jgi:hypothetical protein